MGNNVKSEGQVKDTVLVTGATGFVGHFLCGRLLAQNSRVRGTLLSSENPTLLVGGVEPVIVEPLGVKKRKKRGQIYLLGIPGT